MGVVFHLDTLAPFAQSMPLAVRDAGNLEHIRFRYRTLLPNRSRKICNLASPSNPTVDLRRPSGARDYRTGKLACERFCFSLPCSLANHLDVVIVVLCGTFCARPFHLHSLLLAHPSAPQHSHKLFCYACSTHTSHPPYHSALASLVLGAAEVCST